MTIATVDDIAAGLAIAQRQWFFKNITNPKAAGAYESAWLATGQPGAGAAPPAYTAGSGYTTSRTTTGALTYANGAVQNYLARLFAHYAQLGSLIIADRLWSCGGMGFAASTYTVTTPGSLPARITDNGVACELWVEQFAAAGAASGTLTVNYVEPGGGARAGIIPAVVSAPVIGQMQPVPRQAGSVGVQSLTSCVNSATWTSGSWGMTILKRLAEIEFVAQNVGKTSDWASLGLPPIPADACLMFIICAQGSTGGILQGRATIIDK